MTILLIVISCGKDKKQEVDNADLNSTDSHSEVEFSDKNIQQVYAMYLEIKAGLVNSDIEVVRSTSKKLEETLEDTEEYKQLKATSKLISLTKDLQKQRDFFVTITDEIDNIVSNANIISGEVYKQYCPMAFDGSGGYWLSDSEEIRNPYFGNKMLKCGNVKETIK
ncbi:DUF3347 domain-containing protein [Aquimarina gracilis]|uniref:DUF3347 domain-containing protein n=1 Tax=Aquimarina gracilis TaxID=874422 RepID=A0ABU5ZTI7_9FLAO|nr:DUF3347 domain-containing protein [Aquimarina gracilis]MEB3345293.1 DUF3347 domain-containing protein [Aquimarina gracilis]